MSATAGFPTTTARRDSSAAPVSVIIPCFNCRETLPAAIASVESQTLMPAELILVDDASRDGTAALLREIERSCTSMNVTVTSHQTNLGPSSARNSGWERASSPYIAFLDADDAWHPRKVETQYRWMSAHPEVALTGHPILRMGAEDEWPPLPVDWVSKRIRGFEFLVSNRFSTPSAMLRRELSLRFQPEKRYCEDYLLWLRTVLSEHEVHLLDVPLARIHKARYGEGGLSKNLWKMELGELDVYLTLRRERLIRWPAAIALLAYSSLKFVRRMLLRRG